MISLCPKDNQKSHANHTMRGLRYPQLILERLGFSPCNWVLASTCLPRQIFKFPSTLLSRFEKKTVKEFTSIAQAQMKFLQNCKWIYDRGFWRKVSDLIFHVTVAKVTRLARSMADKIPLVIFPWNRTLR